MGDTKDTNQEIENNDYLFDEEDLESTPEVEVEAAGEAEAEEQAAPAEEAETKKEEAPKEEEAPKKADSEKSFFKKKEKKDKRDERIAELEDQVKRQMAEFDNFRKRTEKEKAQMFETGAKNIIEKLLPVIDSFERGLATIPEDEKGTPVADGMDKIYKQMLTMLTEAGLKQIEARGNEFDPNLHNAVMHVDDENVGENIVVEEFQKGYTYRDSVVRHSMVKVAN